MFHRRSLSVWSRLSADHRSQCKADTCEEKLGATSYKIFNTILKGGGGHELGRKHRDACYSSADAFFNWTVGHQAGGLGGRHIKALRDPRAGHRNNCQVGILSPVTRLNLVSFTSPLAFGSSSEAGS